MPNFPITDTKGSKKAVEPFADLIKNSLSLISTFK